jgi:hypothetical protein
MRRFIVILALLLTAGVLSWWALGFRNWEWHQNLVLEVQTPAGIVSGGSVVAVRVGTTPKWLPGEGAGGMGADVVGEASFVEVAPDRYLFALLGGELDRTLTIFAPGWAGTRQEVDYLATLRETRDVPRNKYPLLVTFTDVTDPKTVQKVDPDNLAASFGPGVSLKRVTLEIADEKVTEGSIASVLPCLKSGRACIPLNKQLPYGDPMRNILNDRFWRNQ